MAVDYSRYLSRASTNTQFHKLKHLYYKEKNSQIPLTVFSLGIPAAEAFMFDSINVQLTDGTEISYSGRDAYNAQQYPLAAGVPSYVSALTELTRSIHKPPCWIVAEGDSMVIATTNNTDSTEQLFHVLFDAGDYVISEECPSKEVQRHMTAMGLRRLSVSCHEDGGLDPDSLAEILSRWDPETVPGTTDKPRIIYLTSDGTDTSLDDKRKIYQLAQTHQLLIVEDDPNCFLRYGELKPSFLSLDTDGRVIRADSLSRVLHVGSDSSFLMGPTTIVSKIAARIGYGTYGNPTIPQHLTSTWLSQFGVDTFLDTRKKLVDWLQRKMEKVALLIDTQLSGLVEYKKPTSGQILWMKMLGDTKDTESLLSQSNGLLPVGSFLTSPHDSRYLGVNVESDSDDTINKKLQRLSEILRPSSLNNLLLNISL